MKLAIASDHAGVSLKQALLARLSSSHDCIDLGTHSSDSVDYPHYAQQVALAVQRGEVERGILICGTGIGMAIAANKVAGIRAAAIHDTFSARAAVEHNDLNLLGLGARVVGEGLAMAVVDAFLAARFEGGRHQRRVDQLAELEATLAQQKLLELARS